VAADPDPNAVEVGVKLRTDVDGFITALRFYKGTQNTGTHIGNLWTSTGTLLASVTFTGETASGWQQVNLPTPVAINANTTYVASYHTAVGHYSVNEPYFASSSFDNPPLHALRDGLDGRNGVYTYGASSFPTQSFNSSNYWVDIVFTTTLGPDTTPPETTLTATPPALTNSRTASFSFTATEAGSTFACRLDGAAFTACGSPQAYNGLTDGSHTFEVRATDPAGNTDPTLASFTWTVDATPPGLSAVAATPGSGGTTATITWTTTEAATSRVDYGTAPASLTLSATNGALVTAHSLVLTGLTPGTTYYYRVTSVDAAGNAATAPPTGDSPASFVTPTPSASFTDTTVADFSAGTPDANTYIAQTADGEVLLRPTVGAEFAGTALPAGWFSTPWGTGGSATVGGGVLTVNGARAGTSTLYGPGRSLEFVATFSGAAYQHVGFGTDFNSAPWATFSTNTGGSLYARTHNGTTVTNTLLPGSWLGAPHRYRIDWNASSVVFSIDGTQVASHPVTITTSLRPLASDYTVGGGTLSVDWLRLSPYATPGTFLSRIFDAGASVTWGTATWTADTPAGTSLTLSVRTGNTPTPDGTWTAFTALPSSGAPIGASARYLQYRADLATTIAAQSPGLRDVTIRPQ
jgi:hypothetical protein